MTSIETFVAELVDLDVRITVEGDRLRCSAPDEALTPELRARLAARKSDLIEFLRKHQAADRSVQPDRLEDEDASEALLSPGQERLWSFASMRPDSPKYNINTAFLLTGPLDRTALERSLGEIQKRHESLRTSFRAHRQAPRQHIAEATPVVLPVINLQADLRSLSPERRRQEVVRLLESEMRRPFDLGSGQLWRPLLLKLSKGVHVLSFTMHHIIFDGASKVVFLRELETLYRAFARNELPPPEEKKHQYADFARWEQQRLTSEVARRQMDYWRTQLAGNICALAVPNDYPRTGIAGASDSYHFELPDSICAALQDLSRQERSSLFVTLLAAFMALLHRYTGQKDLVVCSPFAARDRAEFQRLIGYLNNIVVIRCNIDADSSVREAIGRVRRVVMGALENQNQPLQRIAELPNLARVPLTHAMFSYQDTTSRTICFPDVSASPIDLRKAESDFDLAMYMETDETGRLSGVLEYDSTLFKAESISMLVDNFRSVLEGFATNPDKPLSALSGQYKTREDVERALGEHPQIDQAIVVVGADNGSSIAYLVLNEYDVPSLDGIRDFVRSAFPDYLVPTAFVPLDTIPLLTDGSVDFDRLPLPDALRREGGVAFEAPRSELERDLARIWKKVLWLDTEIGIHDHFSDLGGHSLLSVQLVMEIEQQLQRTVPPLAMSRLSTISEMARIMEGNGETNESRVQATEIAERSDSPASKLSPEIYQALLSYTGSWEGARSHPDSLVVGLNTAGTRAPLYWCLQRYGELTQLARYLGEDQPVFGMRSGNRVMVRSAENIAALAAHYVDEILGLQPDGPFIVGGNCQAAKIAFQIATQLRQRGRDISLLLLMEKFVPDDYDGRVALLFSKESDRNPYLAFRNPELGWRKYYSGKVTVDMISGKHMQFFREPNIQVLAEAITRRIEQTETEPRQPVRQAAHEPRYQQLSTDAYRAELTARIPPTLAAGIPCSIQATITNRSPVAWEPAATSAIVLSNRWLGPDGHVSIPYDGRTPLPGILAPNDTAEAELVITPPSAPGDYIVELDLADEGVTWFGSMGSHTLQSRVTVTQRNAI